MNNRKDTVKEIAIFVAFGGIFLSGCNQENMTSLNSNKFSSVEYVSESSIEVELIEDNLDMEKKESIFEEKAIIESELIPIDYDNLQKEHKILEKNICMVPHSIFDDYWLCEQIAPEITLAEDSHNNFREPSLIEYFLFDFNDDGIDDYLVTFTGSQWEGSHGNLALIIQKKEDGTSKELLRVTVKLENDYGAPGVTDIPEDYSSGYWPIAVLDEKTNGYYDIVLPFSTAPIWKFDQEVQRYE